MKQFAILEATPARLVNVNPRSEKHGKVDVPAVDLRLKITAPNTILDQFKGRELRDALYTSREDVGDTGQGQLDGVDEVSDTPALRVHGLQPVRLDDELTGYSVTFDLGTGRKESLVVLDGCKLKDFEIEALQGGSVTVTFTVQTTSGWTEKNAGKICMLVKRDVSLLMEPPSEDAQPSLPMATVGGAPADVLQH